MKKTIKNLVTQLQSDEKGNLKGGFGQIKGGFAFNPSDNQTCTNSVNCSGTNYITCTNSGTCSSTNSQQCTNNGQGGCS